ncbi:MAG: uracil phosphoribosyltransferase [Clostridiales bacterium]|jgi:uracil phosphoribosyltransferase|nr:uracil phosphoribosyltransferase [Clostridiales bacterium]
MDEERLRVLNHPIVEYYLSILRNKDTPTEAFRHNIKKLAALLTYPLTEFIDSISYDVETPLGTATGTKLQKGIALFPVLRAGLLLSESLSDILPVSFIGPLGILRNKKTLAPEAYYSNIPDDLSKFVCIIPDPIIATGGIICKSIEILKQRNANNILVISIITTKDGIERIFSEHADVKLISCHVDPELKSHGYFVTGIGDVGDRALGANDNAIIG